MALLLHEAARAGRIVRSFSPHLPMEALSSSQGASGIGRQLHFPLNTRVQTLCGLLSGTASTNHNSSRITIEKLDPFFTMHREFGCCRKGVLTAVTVNLNDFAAVFEKFRVQSNFRCDIIVIVMADNNHAPLPRVFKDCHVISNIDRNVGCPCCSETHAAQILLDLWI